jgi:FkbM family methyltransferase
MLSVVKGILLHGWSTVVGIHLKIDKWLYRDEYKKLLSLSINKPISLHHTTTFDIASLLDIMNIQVSGAVIVGAHYGQEIDVLQARIGSVPIVAFEPSEEAFEILKRKYSSSQNVKIFNNALGSVNKEKHDFYVGSNNGQSSSLLKPMLHLNYEPGISFGNIRSVSVRRLDDYALHIVGCNLLVVDTQGTELDVLIGGETIISSFSYIFIEVNRENVYQGCALFHELDLYLTSMGFQLSHMRWWPRMPWGDALYFNVNDSCISSRTDEVI